MNKNRLTNFILERKKSKDILLMSHAVLGYRNLEENYSAVNAFVKAGVDLMELQFPYTDPMADGPTLVEANQKAVETGITIDQCFIAAKKITDENPETAFIIMTYLNILYSRGYEKFATEAKAAGIMGVIIPDLPVQEARQWTDACDQNDISPIFMTTPETSEERLKEIAKYSRGFLYCVARKGITGEKSTFDTGFEKYISQVAEKVSLPIGVGFGVRDKEGVQELKNKADIAIVCSKAIELITAEGIKAASAFLKSLR